MPGSTAELAAQISAGLGRGEFHLVFQPEYDLRSNTVVGFEALLRWTHPTLGELEPDAFIPMAEQGELIHRLTTWVVDTATAEYARWLLLAPTADLVLRVNVSTRQLQGDGLVDTFRTALRRHGIAGDRLCAEITETAPITDAPTARTVVLALQSLGIRVAIDDLAGGYSGLSTLRSLPVDVVKIDRSLVTGLDADDRARTIFAAVLTLAQQLGTDVVAEGVENEREVDALLALGCRRAQGHHLGRPRAGSDIDALLSASTRARDGSDDVPRRPRPGPGPISPAPHR